MFWPFLASVDSVYTLVACFSASSSGGELTPSAFSATVMTMEVEVETDPLNTETDPLDFTPCVSNVALGGSAAMTAPAKSAIHKSATHILFNFIPVHLNLMPIPDPHHDLFCVHCWWMRIVLRTPSTVIFTLYINNLTIV
jgi:hypothetical protein